ncbi:hypothetical protein ACFY9Q_23085 [Streptomyces sp. NPDC012389]|uniref:hypothetical protein n=1 Tax=unclassified Streptomyces TaxID=2593676 RepID=UPI00114CC75A|nr:MULTISPECIES: hypothetical protein [unclassified Streptomyces]MYR95922.1 hypothetical protein [Streptomyces sp. SID4937]
MRPSGCAIPAGQAEHAPDPADGNFLAAVLNRCWAADFSHVRTWSDVVYIAFVADTFPRRVVGWSVTTMKETERLPSLGPYPRPT